MAAGPLEPPRGSEKLEAPVTAGPHGIDRGRIDVTLLYLAIAMVLLALLFSRAKSTHR